MSERERDPMELWVGTWTPQEWAEREARKVEDQKKDDERPATPASADE